MREYDENDEYDPDPTQFIVASVCKNICDQVCLVLNSEVKSMHDEEMFRTEWRAFKAWQNALDEMEQRQFDHKGKLDGHTAKARGALAGISHYLAVRGHQRGWIL